jgi:exonuclease SbcCD, C subunit
VVTGSGGETFLVSLSLALALAGEGRDVAADILFIDEGFGTLSGGPLQRAVALLRSLHSDSHKQVGIISHVEELKSEIPVQIQVIPDVAGAASRVEVRKLGEA